MTNLLQSSENKCAVAPGYYTDYLSNLAGGAKTAGCNAQYVGAQPLQTKAFTQACATAGQYQPTVQTGLGYVGCAANTNITGAAAPFTAAATGAGTSPLCAFNPYATNAMQTTGVCTANPAISSALGMMPSTTATKYYNKAVCTNPAALAQCYMDPYTKVAVQSLSDIAQRNIAQNLSPQAVAAAVGSGQYGSQRGAQVLGQVKAQAEQCLNSQIANMLNTGYQNALTAAQNQNRLNACVGTAAGNLCATTMGQRINAGSTLGNLRQAANTLTGNLGATAQAAQTAENTTQLNAADVAQRAAAAEAAAKNTAGMNAIQGANIGQGMNIACENAMATLGAQAQKISQCGQMFPLTKLECEAKVLQGLSVPIGEKMTMCMSPLSQIGAGLSAGMGVLCSLTGGKGTNSGCSSGSSLLSKLGGALGSLLGLGKGSGGAQPSGGGQPSGATSNKGPTNTPSPNEPKEVTEQKLPPTDTSTLDNLLNGGDPSNSDEVSGPVDCKCYSAGSDFGCGFTNTLSCCQIPSYCVSSFAGYCACSCAWGYYCADGGLMTPEKKMQRMKRRMMRQHNTYGCSSERNCGALPNGRR